MIKRRFKARRVSVARDPRYLEFLRDKGWCNICQRPPAEPAHGPVNGLSSKGSDLAAIPLCRRHHEEQHNIGWPAFEEKYWKPRFSRDMVVAWWNHRYKEMTNDESSK